MSFAELTLCEREQPGVGTRRVRIFAPNVLDLESMRSSIDEIELNGRAGLVLEDTNGIVVGWLMPGEKLNELELSRLHAAKGYLIKLVRRDDLQMPAIRAA